MCLALVGPAMLGLGAVASAQDRLDRRGGVGGNTGADQGAETADEEFKHWGIHGLLDTSLGQGTFVSNEYARNEYVAWLLQATPNYRFNEELSFSARASIIQELTENDSDTRDQRVLLSDTRLRAGYMLPQIPLANIDPSVGLNVWLPTSLASQFESLIFAPQFTLGLSRTFGPITVSYIGAFRKNFHQYSSPTVDPSNFDEDVYLAREGGNERINAFTYSPGGNNVSYAFTNGLSVDWQIIEPLRTSVSYMIVNSFTYNSYEKDDLAAPAAQAGRGQRDAYQAVIDVSYSINDMFGVSTGILTVGTPKQYDNDGFRFPFWDFKSEAMNLTTLYLDFTVTHSL